MSWRRRCRLILILVILLVVLLGYRWQCETMSVVLRLSFRFVALAQVERQVVLDVVDELLLILGVESEDFNETGYLDTFQITVG